MPNFLTKKEQFDWLITNKLQILEGKKSSIKHSDCISVSTVKNNDLVNKAENSSLVKKDEITVTAIINTTNLMDSHDDVHINCIWDKTLKENPRLIHLQEHLMQFDKIISDGSNLKAYVKDFSWLELGYSYQGSTQALVFESTIKQDRNPYMFNQYSKGYVKNHSVGMAYGDLELAINDPEYKAEFEIWQKYIDTIANKDYAESKGYFWAILEAKVIEGSAVPMGSNFATPTLDVKEVEVVETKVNDNEINATKKKFNQDYVTFINLKYRIK